MSDHFHQYMLTANNDEERDRIRELLLADPAFCDEMRELENEWIDAYATGRLAPRERELLHNHLVNTGQLNRVATALAMARSRRPAIPSIFPYAWGIAAAVLLCATATLTAPKWPRDAAVRRQPEDLVPLAPGTLRDSAAVQGVVRHAGRGLQLQLLYEDTSPNGGCVVIVKDGAGNQVDEVRSECGVEFHPYSVNSQLKRGRYSVELSDLEKGLLHTYLFDLGE